MRAGNYRYVIVGAGSAGCVLANRLSWAWLQRDPDWSANLVWERGLF